MFAIRVDVFHHIDIGHPTLDLLKKLVEQNDDRVKATELTALLKSRRTTLAAAVKAFTPTPKP